MHWRPYVPYLFVVGKKSKRKYEDAQWLPNDESKAFVDEICDSLDKLWSKPVGKGLIQAISNAKRVVTIFKDDASGAGSAALPYPGTVENEIRRFIKIRQIPSSALQALAKSGSQVVPPTQQQYAALIHATIERSKVNRDQLALLMGIKRETLDDIELGLEPMKPEAYHRFAMYLYPHLDPGDGSSVGLRFATDQVTQDDPLEIILGHELVHVWRMVTGMRIFAGGWEEEAQTSGIGQFITMPFTENKLRAEHGYGMRTSYSTPCQTAHYQISGAFKGVWPEHLKAWEDWAKDHPKQANKPWKLGKKSTFSNPVTRLFNR